MKNITLLTILITVLFACNKTEDVDPCDKNIVTNLPIITALDVNDEDSLILVVNYSIDYTGHIDGDGITESGVYYSNTIFTPSQSDDKEINIATNDKGKKSVDINLSALSIGTWYFRSYAINCAGIGYGDVVKYSIEIDPCDGSIDENLPTIVTDEVLKDGDNITMRYTISNVGGDNAGISSRGFCWTSLNGNPTITDEKVDEGPSIATLSSTISESINNFTKGETYSFRSFAVNCAGVQYGDVLTLMLELTPCDGNDKENLPELSTDEILKVNDRLEITYTINRVGGDAAGISSRGICWSSVNQNPTIGDDKTDAGNTTSTGSSTVYVEISKFPEGLEFYYRSYATNCAGTTYGNVLEYTYIDYIAQIANNMVAVGGGKFTMGCTGEQNSNTGCGEGDCYSKECPVHEVTIAGFQISKFELTQAQWREVMGSDPEKLNFKGCDQCPVESISWDDVQPFLDILNTKSGKNYRLPTESEWEYAARGGNQSKGFKYSGSDDMDEVGWTGLNSRRKTHFVGEKKENEIGLYDMSGNVYEFCADDYHSDYTGAPADGSAWIDGPRATNRSSRGGSWINYNRNCRVSNRYNDRSVLTSNTIGVRLAHD